MQVNTCGTRAGTRTQKATPAWPNHNAWAADAIFIQLGASLVE